MTNDRVGELRALLMGWDPIGIADIPSAAAEYDIAWEADGTGTGAHQVEPACVDGVPVWRCPNTGDTVCAMGRLGA